MSFPSKVFSLMLASVLMLASCGGNSSGSEAARGGAGQGDTAKVDCSLALMATLDCLPFFYAETHGIYRRLGLDVAVTPYRSQLACDTALTRGAADIVYSDHLVAKRAGQKAAEGWETALSLNDAWTLVAYRGLRIRNVKALEGRDIAITRSSESLERLEATLQANGLSAEKVYLPQINDLNIRMRMAAQGQIAAAMLTEPYTAAAAARGNTLLPTEGKGEASHSRLLRRKGKKALPDGKWQMIIKGYNMAVDSINERGLNCCADILVNHYGLDPQMVDTMRLPRPLSHK